MNNNEIIAKLRSGFGGSDAGIYFANESDKGNNKISKAVISYARLRNDETVWVLYDDTLFGSAADGFLISSHGIYVHNFIGGENVFIGYDDIEKIYSFKKGVINLATKRSGEKHIDLTMGKARQEDIVKLLEMSVSIFVDHKKTEEAAKERISKEELATQEKETVSAAVSVATVAATNNDNVKNTKKCDKCGNIIPESSKFCFQCGNKVSEKKACIKCGAELKAGSKFCIFCGAQVGNKAVCPECGTELQAGAKFCFSCGRKIVEGEKEKLEEPVAEKTVEIVLAVENVQENSEYNKENKKTEENSLEAAYRLFNMGIAYRKGDGVPQDYERAFECFAKAAKLGLSDAEFMLGKSWFLGQGTKEDYNKSFDSFLLAAKDGNVPAKYAVGMCYEYGIGISKDLIKAFEWYMESAEQDLPVAEYKVATCYWNGTGTKDDLGAAIFWYNKAAEDGDPMAECKIADQLLGSGEEDKAFELYMKAAEQGNCIAEYRVGMLYFGGDGVEQDYEKGVKYFARSAEQGYSEAEFIMGMCYMNGVSVEKDNVKSFEWYLKAAKQGQVDAEYCVGICFSEGIGVEEDTKKAFEWFKMAAEHGNNDAEYMVGLFYDKGIGVEEDKEKGIEWYMKAAQHGNSEAAYEVGFHYMLGSGGYNAVKSIEWIMKSADGGYRVAKYAVGLLYQKGIVVEKDDLKAEKMFTAAEQDEITPEEKRKAELLARGIAIAAKKSLAPLDIDSELNDNNEKALQTVEKDSESNNIGRLTNENPIRNLQVQLDAAQHGSLEAEFHVGVCYELQHEYEKAIEWYEKALGHDDLRAKYRLGRVYRYGQGVEQDLDKAFTMISEVAEAGNPYALRSVLEEFDGYISDKQKMKILEFFVGERNEFAVTYWGECLAIGRLLEKNEEKAKEILEEVIEQWENTYAMRCYANLLFEEASIMSAKENYSTANEMRDEALKYMQRAADDKDNPDVEACIYFFNKYRNSEYYNSDEKVSHKKATKSNLFRFALGVAGVAASAMTGSVGTFEMIGGLMNEDRYTDVNVAQKAHLYQKRALEINIQNEIKYGYVFEGGEGF